MYARLSAISSDPITTWQVGNYAVRAACHSYLNQMAARSAGFSLAAGGLGIAGPAAAGFLVAGGNPVGAAAASTMAALGSTFLGLFNASGAIPYTMETAGIIQRALDAYELGVNMAPPESVPQAVSYVDDLWWQCSAGGYAMLASKAISTATVGTQMNGMFSFRSLSPTGRPVIVVNPAPAASTEEPITRALSNPRRQPSTRARVQAQEPRISATARTPAHQYDPDWPARRQWLRDTMTYISALDGPRK